MSSSEIQGVALLLYLIFNGLTSLFIVSGVFGLFQGGIVPMYAVICRELLPPREAGAKIGLVISATIFGMAFGGYISGVIFDLTSSYRMDAAADMCMTRRAWGRRTAPSQGFYPAVIFRLSILLEFAQALVAQHRLTHCKDECLSAICPFTKGRPRGRFFGFGSPTARAPTRSTLLHTARPHC